MVQRPGVALLRELIETIKAEPNITTAGLLERFRNHEQGRHLGRLAAVELPMDEGFDCAAELTAALSQLSREAVRDRFNFLVEKQRDSSLSDAERAELRELGRQATNSG